MGSEYPFRGLFDIRISIGELTILGNFLFMVWLV